MHKYRATILNKQPHGRLKFLDPSSFYTQTPPLNDRALRSCNKGQSSLGEPCRVYVERCLLRSTVVQQKLLPPLVSFFSASFSALTSLFLSSESNASSSFSYVEIVFQPWSDLFGDLDQPHSARKESFRFLELFQRSLGLQPSHLL